ncbi:hypothetical protein [Methylococcus geothermalis]|uniref:hypothetical protein n=1 Tax=Methylococcus geothermalis TaxID=2681310 RepID=UPI001E392C4A|nr:hypothetical protein [Methylococcus geothermalis]
MATVHFSVPEDVKNAFNEAFKNKTRAPSSPSRCAKRWSARRASSAAPRRSAGFWSAAGMPRPLRMKSCAPHGKTAVHDPDGRCQRRAEMVFFRPATTRPTVTWRWLSWPAWSRIGFNCSSIHLFDTRYHAVALLVTADRRYHDKACGFGRIVWLADFRLLY